MKRMLLLAMCAMFATVLFASVSSAALPNNEGVRVAVHAVDGCILKGCDPICDADPVATQPTLPCSNYNVVRSVNSGTFAYVVVGNAGSGGVTGISYGIDYAPVNKGAGFYIDTSLCTDGLEFPSVSPNVIWPNPQSGNRITWGSCQNLEIGSDGIHATATSLYLYAYSDETFYITPHTALATGAELDVTDCAGATVKLLSVTHPAVHDQLTAKIQFGAGSGDLGYNPCGVLAVEPTTWGSIKTLFEEDSE